MEWYCKKCRKLHSDDELCPSIRARLEKDPSLLAGAADFTAVAGTYGLVSSQALDSAARAANSLLGTNLSYEGTHQIARDIQVFNRLNTEAFSRSGVFSTPESAKSYLENVMKLAENSSEETGKRIMGSFTNKLTGYGQEVDWLRAKQGQISALWQKSTLLDNNAAGVDGITVNRFTGKTISRTTIKATGAGEREADSIRQNVRKVQEAIQKGNATENDIIYGPKGTAEAARSLGLKNPVQEGGTTESIGRSNERLTQKIKGGKAYTEIKPGQVMSSVAQGAVIGAAVGLTVSCITSYIRYRDGELTRDEAFREISESSVKGALTGGAMAGISLFLPGGVLGFAANMVIGVYISAICGNLLDEVYGKGAYGAILNASGYIYGTAVNLSDCVRQIKENTATARSELTAARNIQRKVEASFNEFDALLGR